MKKILAFFSVILLFNISIKADEGMWLLPLIQELNIDEMQQMGCELSAEEIYSINKTSLKDAIVMFGRGCTGEVISDQGLVLTNHHCGRRNIQQHSSPEHDYLTDGFWAASMEDEIPTPGLNITFLVRIEDVTDKIYSVFLDGMTEIERQDAATIKGDNLAREATAGTHYSAIIKNFYGGNKYYMLVYEKFTDIRMVGAPPSSIGRFGADTDNWMWPRHTGDFSLFRIYANKDNKPADYSEDNVPYKPKHHLPISIKGIEKNDFAMILGYPGGTDRYMTSMEIDELIKITNTNRIFIRGIRQEILLEDMLANDTVRIKYANKYAGSANYWKNSIGMNNALKKLKVIEKKEENENNFTNWLSVDSKRKVQYGEALSLINNSVNSRKEYLHAKQYISESMLKAMEIFDIAYDAKNLYDEFGSENKEVFESTVNDLKISAEKFYKNYNAPTDQKVIPVMLKVFAENVDEQFYPEIYNTIKSRYGNDYKQFTNEMFESSIFTDKAELFKFLENPSKEFLEKDLAFVAANSINEKYDKIVEKLDVINRDFDKGHRLYIGGIMEMNKGKAMYPDANFTMRLSYGSVLDYYPMDAVHYNYITTLKGVMEKEDPDNWEFVVPEKLKDLYNNKDYGQYGLKNGEMPVAFLSTNDITGGNSGSPVINSKGELIGTAFDGNWEAMSGDIVFESELQRCINVDVRYTLFIIEKFAGAQRLINEMTIIK
ncbi:MAG: S46 family peptidase [Bacteroidales bacterium]|nr:S46 family peptidase [Bacteroidales bacterium]